MKKRNYTLKRLVLIIGAAVVVTAGVAVGSAVSTITSIVRDAEDQDKVKTYYALPEDTVILEEAKSDQVICLSSDRSIADAAAGGRIQARSVGTADIHVVDLETKTAKQVKIRVAYKQRITTARDSYSAVYGDKSIHLGAKTDNTDGTRLIYESDDPKVASVDEKGNVKIGSVGTANIHIRAEASENYHGADKDVTVTVGKKGAEITAAQTAYSLPATGEKVKIETKASGKGKITYESEDPSIAKVDEEGNIEAVSVGVTKIKIRQAESENYQGAETAVDVEITKPTVSDRVLGAIDWAVNIANDDSFAYGTGKQAHKRGCYFCGTNSKYKPSGYEKTYCCNPFIFAAYAHGAQDPDILRSCQNGGCGGMSPSDWTPYGFELLGTVSDVSYSDLLPGDVILSDTTRGARYHHVWMYCGEDQYVEASGGGWHAGSIAVKNNAERYYNQYKRSGCTVVRYVKQQD